MNVSTERCKKLANLCEKYKWIRTIIDSAGKPGFGIVIRFLKTVFENEKLESMPIRLYQPKTMETCFKRYTSIPDYQKEIIDTTLLELDKYSDFFTPQLNSTIQSNMKNVMKTLIIMINKKEAIDETKVSS